MKSIRNYKEKQKRVAKRSKNNYWSKVKELGLKKRVHKKSGSKVLFNNTYSDYKEYINSEEWNFIKECHYDSQFNRRCHSCGSTKDLEVHHSRYDRLGSPSEFHDLHTLCRGCHQNVHDLVKRFGEKLYYVTIAVIVKG